MKTKMDELKYLNIQKDDACFHLTLLKYYYNFIEFYKQEENAPDDVLHFDFGKETYSINYSTLQDKAFEEAEALKNKYGLDDESEPTTYQI